MKKLKILFNTSKGAFKSPGGGEVQLLETKKELEELGHSVKILEQENYAVDFGDFDIFHNFNIHRDNYEHVEKAKKAGLAVAISTIYWHSPVKKIVSGTSSKTLAVEMINFFAPRVSKVGRMLSMADALLPNSEAEAAQLKKIFGISGEKIFVVPNGVDKRFKQAKPDLFVKTFGLQDFVLYVGRVEERKNVLSLVKAMKGIGQKLVIIGEAVPGKEPYLQKCKNEAGSNVVFLEPIPHDSKLLESAYAACKVFALPSWYETPGLAALEAGLAGANLVVTEEGCTKEYFGKFASHVNPKSVEDIKEKILLELAREKSKQLSEHIAKNFLWENTARETEKAYAAALEETE